MNFYEFEQNNSGGTLIQNKKLCHRLFIEARTQQKAEEKAIRMGVYYDGVADGEDCACCGDRWSKPDELIFPYRYSSFDKKEAEEITDKYKTDYGKTTWNYGNTRNPDPTKYDVIFRDIESYAQYLTDNYSIGKGIDGRIYYNNGKVIDIK